MVGHNNLLSSYLICMNLLKTCSKWQYTCKCNIFHNEHVWISAAMVTSICHIDTKKIKKKPFKCHFFDQWSYVFLRLFFPINDIAIKEIRLSLTELFPQAGPCQTTCTCFSVPDTHSTFNYRLLILGEEKKKPLNKAVKPLVALWAWSNRSRMWSDVVSEGLHV